MSFADCTLVSLGVDCRARYQISLFRARKADPNLSRKDFEAKLFSSARSPSEPGTYFFDWLITPAAACVGTINSDFKNVFDQSDLNIMPSGSVQNTKNGIIFQHNFTRTAGKVLPETIKSEYEIYQSKVNYIVNKTLNLMDSNEYVIYVRVGGALNDAEKIAEAIESRHPRHRFKVLLVTMVDSTCGNLETISDRIIRYEMNNTVEKPPEHKWQGDDTRWQAMLTKLFASDGQAA